VPINSKQKGKRGEREFAKLCRDHGYDARRSQQYAGGVDSADVIGLPGIHIEVKLRDRITEADKLDFIKQAIRDSQMSAKFPIVAHKEKYRQWYVSMEMRDFAYMYTVAYGAPFEGGAVTKTFQVVTMTVEAWFEVYKEFEACMWLKAREEV
jgi:Holliday junction resolvase